MSRSRYTQLINSFINSLIHWLKKITDNFRVYLECVHPAFLTTLVVLVYFEAFPYVTRMILLIKVKGSYLHRFLVFATFVTICFIVWMRMQRENLLQYCCGLCVLRLRHCRRCEILTGRYPPHSGRNKTSN